MHSEHLVELALKSLSCAQKDLAIKLKVSPTQISKWKKGEHMSHDMEQKLRALTKIGDLDPAFVLAAGSLHDAVRWERLMHHLADMANENAETGYDTVPLNVDEEMSAALLCGTTFDVLTEMGIAFPKAFPKELDLDYEDLEDDEWEVIMENAYSNIIYRIYKSLNDVYGFYAAYVSELINDDELDLTGTPAENIEPCLMSLAACKIETSKEFAPKFNAFRHKTQKEYQEWLSIVKDRAFRAGVPLRAEIMGLVYSSDDALGHEAEAQSLGFNASRLHPDVYMNELLIGMRTIHQVLPAIMKKLGIADEFQLDTSELSIR